ncbi:MAG: hypothetical protein R3C14_54230 [Caldilineaceae bacterium]
MHVRPLLFSAIFVIMIGVGWPRLHLFAQDNTSGNTLPGGTLPEEVVYLPIIQREESAAATPTPEVTPTPTVTFEVLGIVGPSTDRPAANHGDLNLALRSYVTTTAVLELINVNGKTDANAPQLDGIFSPPRLPTFVAAYQVNDWDWNCGTDGCKGAPIANPPVTLLEVAVPPGEALFIPTRNAEIYAGGFKALVLYAAATRITLVYTREDTAAHGYVVHLEDVMVDPALLALYTEKNAAGRHELPALHANERFANAVGATIKIAIRDSGSFMDPRSRKDWWKNY